MKYNIAWAAGSAVFLAATGTFLLSTQPTLLSQKNACIYALQAKQLSLGQATECYEKIAKYNRQQKQQANDEVDQILAELMSGAKP
jgi:hypothetical protein